MILKELLTITSQGINLYNCNTYKNLFIGSCLNVPLEYRNAKVERLSYIIREGCYFFDVGLVVDG